MNHSAADGLADRFSQDGYVSPVPVMPAAQADLLRAQLEQIEARRGGALSMVLNAKAHLLMPFLWDLVHDERILKPVRDILGADVLCWGSSFFTKDAGAPDHVPLHQDSTCWGLSEQRGLTAWLALTPSTRVSGCLQVAPGTHRTRQQHVVRSAVSSMLPLGEELAIECPADQLEDCCLAPGEMSLHHPLLVHGSSANRSSDIRRIGFAIRYIPGHIRQTGDIKGHATLVSGRDHGTFHLETGPEADFAPEALRRHRKIISDATRIVAREAKALPQNSPNEGPATRGSGSENIH